jgi:hypothetical protein
MKHYGEPLNRVVERSILKFVGQGSLSSGFVDFLQSRSSLMRSLIIVTCLLGNKAQMVWPFSLEIGRAHV